MEQWTGAQESHLRETLVGLLYIIKCVYLQYCCAYNNFMGQDGHFWMQFDFDLFVNTTPKFIIHVQIILKISISFLFMAFPPSFWFDSCHELKETWINQPWAIIVVNIFFLFETRVWGSQSCVDLTAALLGSQSLVSLLGNGQTDTLSTRNGHPWLVTLDKWTTTQSTPHLKKSS